MLNAGHVLSGPAPNPKQKYKLIRNVKMYFSEIEPKQRIKEAALKLFARNGYKGTGLREIAKEANVNVAMISYYFGGKTELMKLFLDEYHERIQNITIESYNAFSEPEELIRETLKRIIEFTRENADLCMITMNETNFFAEDLHSYRIEKVKNSVYIGKDVFVEKFMKSQNIGRKEAEEKHNIFIAVVGSALAGILYVSFVHKGALRDGFGVSDPDKYNEFFTDLILSFFVNGVGGVLKGFNINDVRIDS